MPLPTTSLRGNRHVLTLSQALDKRGAGGVPLPTAYPSLKHRGAEFCRGQLSLVLGPGSAGKSLILFNLVHKMPGVTVLAFLLDTTRLTFVSRFASLVTGEPYTDIKRKILEGDTSYQELVAEAFPDLHVIDTGVYTLEDVQRGVDAFEQRFGLPPDAVIIDNIGNMSTQFENEWQMLKVMSLELNNMGLRDGCAYLVAHHTTDKESDDPAKRSEALGKISQYPRLMLTVQYVTATGEYKVAIVKNSEGVSDTKAEHPVTLYADPARMIVQEHPIHQDKRWLRSVTRGEPSIPVRVLTAGQRQALAKAGMEIDTTTGEVPARSGFGGY